MDNPGQLLGAVDEKQLNRLDINPRTCKTLLRSLRCLGEHGFPLPASRWRTVERITQAQAESAHHPRSTHPTHFEHGYLYEITEITSLGQLKGKPRASKPGKPWATAPGSAAVVVWRERPGPLSR